MNKLYTKNAFNSLLYLSAHCKCLLLFLLHVLPSVSPWAKALGGGGGEGANSNFKLGLFL